MISLDSINTSEGCLQHLLLAEARTPAQANYNFDEIKTVLRAMKSVVTNRKASNKGYIFCSVGATSIIDYICAPVSTTGCQAKQFKGFSKNASGNVVVDPAILTRINDAVSIANNTSDPRNAKFKAHVNEVISVSKNAITDPYNTIPGSIGGEAVLKAVYGWRTSESADPGGAYVKIPQSAQHPNGNIQGIQFYTIKAVAVFLVEAKYKEFFV